MNNKLIISLLAILLISGCNQNQSKPDYRNFQPEEKIELPLNTGTCYYETSMKTEEISYVRNLADQVLQYFKHQEYGRIKPFLTEDFKKSLETKGIEEKKLDVFLPGASTILPAMPQFELISLYEVKTNPKSTEISGFCNDAHNDLERSVYYKFNNPSEDEVNIFMLSRRAATSASLNLDIRKINGQWLINNISVYPGGAAGKTSFNLYQIASQLEQEGNDLPAYLYYDLITSYTPVNDVIPTYIANSYQSISKLKEKIDIPGPKENEIQDWQIEPEYYLPVYRLKILPVKDKLVLLLGYITETDDMQENNYEAQMLAKYVVKHYPVLANYFSDLIIEATFDVPTDTKYQRYATSHKLQ
ncbi:MAG: hypothetical protein AB7V50_08230 [Vampirovibrionia bacterium]